MGSTLNRWGAYSVLLDSLAVAGRRQNVRKKGKGGEELGEGKREREAVNHV